MSATISHTASVPTTVSRGGVEALAAKLLSRLTVIRPSTPSVALDTVLGAATMQLTVVVGSFGDVDPCLGVDGPHFTEAPANGVDRVGAPRADPASTAVAVEQPAVATQRNSRAGGQMRPLHMFDWAERVGTHELSQQSTHGMETKLEIAQCDRACISCFLGECCRFFGMQPERLVAEHCLARGEHRPYVRGVQERRRVHAHQIDIGTCADTGDLGVVTR